MIHRSLFTHLIIVIDSDECDVSTPNSSVKKSATKSVTKSAEKSTKKSAKKSKVAYQSSTPLTKLGENSIFSPAESKSSPFLNVVSVVTNAVATVWENVVASPVRSAR